MTEKPRVRKHFLVLITILLLISSPLASSESAADEGTREVKDYTINEPFLTKATVRCANRASIPRIDSGHEE